jgi:choline dehydrogenase-like flavoprotein
VATLRRLLRDLGYPLVLARRLGIATTSHMCGTVRFGTDPDTAVLDPFCKAFELDNLYVVDGSFFPSSAAVNPALTIAAQALRVADHLAGVAAPAVAAAHA